MIESISRRSRGICVVCGVFSLLLVLSLQSYAKCPVYETTTLVVRAATGDLQVDTAGRDSVV